MKIPFYIYADMDSLFKKIDTSHENLGKSSTTEQLLAIHYLRIVYLMPQKTNIIIIEDCMKNFSRALRKHAAKIISYEKIEMKPLTDEENKSYRKQKVIYV